MLFVYLLLCVHYVLLLCFSVACLCVCVLFVLTTAVLSLYGVSVGGFGGLHQTMRLRAQDRCAGPKPPYAPWRVCVCCESDLCVSGSVFVNGLCVRAFEPLELLCVCVRVF